MLKLHKGDMVSVINVIIPSGYVVLCSTVKEKQWSQMHQRKVT